MEETATLWTVGKQKLNLWGFEETTGLKFLPLVRGINEVIVQTQCNSPKNCSDEM